MKLSELITIASGLRQLDGRPRVIKDGGVEKVIQQTYDFTPNVRFAVAKNIARLDSVLQSYTTVRNELVQKMADGTGSVPAAKMNEFTRLDQGLLAQEESVKLTKLSLTDLNLQKNEIPPTVIAMLMAILEEGEDKIESDEEE